MKQLALRDFLEYRFLSDVNYAPGGGSAAFVVKISNEEDNCYDSSIWIRENGENRKLTGLDRESKYYWEDKEHILFPAVRSTSEKKRQKDKEIFTSFYRINIHGGEAQRAFELPMAVSDMKQVEGSVYAVLADIDAKYPNLYQMSKEEKKRIADHYKEEEDYQVIDELPFWENGGSFTANHRTALFLADIEKGTCERITEPYFDVNSLEVQGGKILYTGERFHGKRNNHQLIYRYDRNKKSISCLYEKQDLAIWDIFCLGEKIIVLATDEQRYGINENPYLYQLDPEAGNVTVFWENQQSIGSSVGTDCKLGKTRATKVVGDGLYFVTTRRNRSELHYLDQNGKESVVVSKEGSFDTFDVSEEKNEVLFIGLYENKLQELYSATADQGAEVKQCSELNKEILEGKYVASYEKMTIESQGVDIDGWVLKPYEYDPKKRYPAILDIHGGPKTVYGEVFYHEMQLWASQGYFVFFCNPTGGDGRGNEFADIRGKYGTIDYENLMDFTDEVLKQYPAIDEERVAVTGGSYGGFMTNWIVGHTDRFKAAATQRSIANWVSFYGLSDIGSDFGGDQTGANIYENVEKMWFHSPLKYAGNVKTPTLFIHSNEDYRCPMAEGMQFYTALADRGVPVRMCYFKGENHELSRSGKPKHRERRLKEITEWIEKYCGDDRESKDK